MKSNRMYGWALTVYLIINSPNIFVAIQFAVTKHSEMYENYIGSVNEKLPGTCVHSRTQSEVHLTQDDIWFILGRE